ncbi:MAG: folate-binding protein YgfZ [Holosporaceae bacterium]|nr:MAG: folate-binding protein YgfZ [Holosporaceae bacterium]
MWRLLNYRSVIAVMGKDRHSFLEGLITQAVPTINDGPRYGLMLTAKGRFMWDFFLVPQEDAILLTPAHKDVAGFIKKLSMYRLQSDVTVTHLEDYGVAVSLEKPDADFAGTIFTDPRHPELGFVCVGPKNQIEATEDRVPYEAQRFLLNVPEGPLDLEQEKTIPLEAQMDRLNAISWMKGCYLGQELTARTKHTGVVRKNLYSFRAEGPVEVGQDVLVCGEKVGTIKSIYKDGTKGFLLLKDMRPSGGFFVGETQLSIQIP